MTAQFDRDAIDQGLVASVFQSYAAAQTLLGDATAAEALVIGAVHSLDPEDVTSNAIRGAVVARLVRAQLMMRCTVSRGD